MSLANLKLLLDILPKLFAYCKNHRIINLVKMGIMMMTFYMAFTVYFVRNSQSDETKRLNIITKDMGSIVKQCGELSFVSWLTVENKFSSRSKIRFNEVYGCVGGSKEHCPVSVKISNEAYFKEYYLRYGDSEILKETPSNVVINCKKIDGEFECPQQETPLFLRQMAKLTNLELSKINYVLVRDILRKDIIYIFTLSFAEASKPTCSTQVGNTLLQSLSINANKLQ